MFGLASETMDVMMRASTRRADVRRHHRRVPLKGRSPDWRRADSLIEEGYRAAEAMRISCCCWLSRRPSSRPGAPPARRRRLPVPAFVQLDGFGTERCDTAGRAAREARPAPVNIDAVERDIATIGGLDRYQSVTWRMMRDPARGVGLRAGPRQTAGRHY